MRAWVQGARLVCERALLENVRSRTFKLVTGLLLALAIAAVTVPQLLRDDGTTYTLATVGAAPAELVEVLEATAAAAQFELDVDAHADAQAVRTAIRDGEATAGLVGDTLFVSAEADATFPAVVSQAVVSLETEQPPRATPA